MKALKRGLLIVLAVCFIVSMVVGCGSSGSQSSTAEKKEEAKSDAPKAEQPKEEKAAGKKLRFAMIGHATDSSFFAVMKKGAEDACKQLGVEISYMGPKQFDLGQQVSMIESAVEGGYDGIATVLMDPKAYNKVVEKAKEKGLPVIAFNCDALESGRDAFVGQNMEESGYALGKYMFEKMNGEGKYLIASCAPGVQVLVERIEGIKRAQKEYPNIQLVNVVDMGQDMTKAVGIIENAYTANPDLTAILGTDVYAEAIGTFIASKKLEGKLLGGGFDLTPGTLKHIKNNAMQVTIGQNPYLQGYYPMIMMHLQITKGIKPADMNSGLDIVDITNVDEKAPE